MRERLHTRLMGFLNKQSQRRDIHSLLTDISLTMAKEVDAIEERLAAIERWAIDPVTNGGDAEVC